MSIEEHAAILCRSRKRQGQAPAVQRISKAVSIEEGQRAAGDFSPSRDPSIKRKRFFDSWLTAAMQATPSPSAEVAAPFGSVQRSHLENTAPQ